MYSQTPQNLNLPMPDSSDILIAKNLEALVWPEYLFSKIINALQIKSISEPVKNDVGIGMTTISFVDETQQTVEVLPMFITIHNPQPGDYLALIDGVIHCLNKDFFESRAVLAISKEEITHS